MSTRLCVRNLRCLRNGIEVFSDLSVDLVAGRGLILSGANGSGKSSLLRILAGLLTPAAGERFWNGLSGGSATRWIDGLQQFGVFLLGHHLPLKASLTVRDNLLFWQGFLKRPCETLCTVPQAIDEVGLSDCTGTPAGRLSAGQRQRAGLALLRLASPCGLWLLDEPATALDAPARRLLTSWIDQHLRERGGMAVVASHGGLHIPAARLLMLPEGTTGQQ